jgi:hypothetical protein
LLFQTKQELAASAANRRREQGAAQESIASAVAAAKRTEQELRAKLKSLRDSLERANEDSK